MSLVRKNIFVLFIIQGTNYIFPLLTIPYLARVFGPTSIGELALAQSIILYLSLIVDFGFNLSVTRRISIAFEKGECLKINQIFTQTIIIKFIIFVFVLMSIYVLGKFVPQINSIENLIFIGCISLLGSVFNPIWLFQGVQKMGMLLVPTTFSKIISLILIFLFIKSPNDLNLAMLFTSLSVLITAVISLYYVKKENIAKFSKIKISESWDLINESFYIFLSYIGSSIYTTMNTFIISFFVGFKEIGLYSSADKVVMTAQSLMSPIHQAIFPNLSSFLNKKEYFIKFKKFSLILVFISTLISFVLFFFSQIIVLILFGEDFKDSVKILKILSPLPTIISLGVVFGQWGLIVIGETKVLGKIYVTAGLLHLCHVFFLLNKAGVYGAAISILITETLVSTILGLVFFAKIRKII